MNVQQLQQGFADWNAELLRCCGVISKLNGAVQSVQGNAKQAERARKKNRDPKPHYTAVVGDLRAMNEHLRELHAQLPALAEQAETLAVGLETIMGV